MTLLIPRFPQPRLSYQKFTVQCRRCRKTFTPKKISSRIKYCDRCRYENKLDMSREYHRRKTKEAKA